jgi:pyridoxine 4-dehydrogenase
LQPDGSPEFVKKSVNHCLEMLGGRGRIDMFECARRDPNVPLEQTLCALAELVNEDEIGGVALSEVSADTIREAAKITKIVAVEAELSLWSTEPLTNGIAKACAELHIPIIAQVTLNLKIFSKQAVNYLDSYSPMGRGMLTGRIKSFEDIPDKDIRKLLPRFQPENFENNMKLVKELEAIATKKSCTLAQLALGWVRSLQRERECPRSFLSQAPPPSSE